MLFRVCYSELHILINGYHEIKTRVNCCQ